MARPDRERIRAIYDREASRYDGGLTERLALRARRTIGKLAEGRVLEIGTGTGLNFPHYQPGTPLTGIDLSPNMLEVARRRAAGLGLEAELREMDAERLEFPDGVFDTVVYSLCLCTIPDPARALAEGVRVARPGARMIFFEHLRSDLAPVALLQDLINPLMVGLLADHWNRRTLETVRAAGVELERVRRAWLGSFVLASGRSPAAAGGASRNAEAR